LDCTFTVKGHLDQRWSDWFNGLTITHRETGESVLTGQLPDQAALHGVLTVINDPGSKLDAVACQDGSEGTRTPVV
jgi:hypothetical protein